ncbi:MAG: hypothetical protein IKX60_07710 [Bacteroidales bacterium]|nr:hypothetical protein [Bacteroidales bacterium]
MKKLLLIMAATLLLASCGDKSGKSVVIYYSQTGTTETVAKAIAEDLGIDMIKVVLKEDYPLDFNQTIEICQKQMQAGILPELGDMKVDLGKYDTIYLGYPIWFGTIALPMKSFLTKYNLAGKKVVPFCTYGTGGRFDSVRDLKALCPDAVILNSLGVRQNNAPKARSLVAAFLANDPTAVATFGEKLPVEEGSKAMEVFQAAMADFNRFPLTPETYSVQDQDPEQWVFNCASTMGFGGEASPVAVYVCVPEDGDAPFIVGVER